MVYWLSRTLIVWSINVPLRFITLDCFITMSVVICQVRYLAWLVFWPGRFFSYSFPFLCFEVFRVALNSDNITYSFFPLPACFIFPMHSICKVKRWASRCFLSLLDLWSVINTDARVSMESVFVPRALLSFTAQLSEVKKPKLPVSNRYLAPWFTSNVPRIERHSARAPNEYLLQVSRAVFKWENRNV